MATDKDGVDTTTIVGTGSTYDEAMADVQGQVPDEWQLLFVREE